MENIGMPQEQNQEGLMPLDELAATLDELQSVHNDGRGISCVKDMVSSLQRGNLDEARRIAWWDHDKISGMGGAYTDVLEFIRDELFKGEAEHPWSVSERLRSEANE